ncbi:MAG: 2-C-methyl-D-erythritol 2,4-cyclodiphosphate synthase [Acidobacteria bacterium]|nr:2-C-methyl-D-erythritol 2,4-cyclodiphosphate synthase [Acidobacteriota bacterium]
MNQQTNFRIGTGYDIHRLEIGRPLILGGIEIPFEKGLVGHSDADVISHAICDALLGAIALGDIGEHFPDTDPNYKGVSSLKFLEKALTLLREHGYKISNIDITICAERPKLGKWKNIIKEKLAETLQISITQINIKGKTNEGLDSIGRGEAIAVSAIALIYSN